MSITRYEDRVPRDPTYKVRERDPNNKYKYTLSRPISSSRDQVIKVLGIEEITKIPIDLVKIIVDYGFDIHYEHRAPFDAAHWKDFFGVKVVDCELPEEYFKWALSKCDIPQISKDKSSTIVLNETLFKYPILLPQRITEINQK